jgi:hypothetical protein
MFIKINDMYGKTIKIKDINSCTFRKIKYQFGKKKIMDKYITNK